MKNKLEQRIKKLERELRDPSNWEYVPSIYKQEAEQRLARLRLLYDDLYGF